MPLQPLAPPQTALEAAQDLFAGTCEITALSGHYHHHFQNCYGVIATALANAEIQTKELAALKEEHAALLKLYDKAVDDLLEYERRFQEELVEPEEIIGKDYELKEDKKAVKGTLSTQNWHNNIDRNNPIYYQDTKVRSITGHTTT